VKACYRELKRKIGWPWVETVHRGLFNVTLDLCWAFTVSAVCAVVGDDRRRDSNCNYPALLHGESNEGCIQQVRPISCAELKSQVTVAEPASWTVSYHPC
jgi:hypothetical protein